MTGIAEKHGKIFLIGFMGCGKSTLGHKLAARTGYDFIDLDKTIESESGLSVPDYFSLHGEKAFRVMERDILQNTEFPEKSVIATGGGAPCFFDNMQWMNEHGNTVYICLAPKTLAARLKSEKVKRPLIMDLNDEQLVKFIEKKLEERNVYYRQAHYIVDGLSLTAEKLAEYLQLC